MKEIRQNQKTVLSSTDGFSIPMFYNNLQGINMDKNEYLLYLRYVAYGSMGFHPGIISYHKDGVLQKECVLPAI